MPFTGGTELFLQEQSRQAQGMAIEIDAMRQSALWAFGPARILGIERLRCGGGIKLRVASILMRNMPISWRDPRWRHNISGLIHTLPRRLAARFVWSAPILAFIRRKIHS